MESGCNKFLDAFAKNVLCVLPVNPLLPPEKLSDACGQVVGNFCVCESVVAEYFTLLVCLFHGLGCFILKIGVVVAVFASSQVSCTLSVFF